jgi:uncharacterized protein YgiM (DUF1202 family)
MTSKFKLQWPVDDHTITQYFGENPQVYAKFNQAGHEGVDFLAPLGANIYACADGQVFDVRSNDGNAYGIHVRVRHRVNGQEYHTVYAHLSRALVSVGQRVQAGERVGLSGNTGHSFGPHLHLTLKLIGAKTSGYPDGVVDPLPYLKETEVPAPSDLTIYTTEGVRLRAGPTTASAQLAWLDQGEPLTVLGDASAARARVGQEGQWIQVRRADGMDGYVAAWYVQLQPPSPATPEPEPEPVPAGALVVYATEALNVRRGPSAGTSRVAIALPHEPLTVVGDRQAALAILGDRGEWLQVRLPDPSSDSGQQGIKGHVTAWYVQTEPGPAPEPLLAVSPTEDMNMRERPEISGRLIRRLAQNAPLTVYDDPERAQALVGRYDEWLHVKTAQGQRGWVAAWYVQVRPPSFGLPEPAPEPAPAGPLVVYATEPLNVRRGPTVGTSRVAIALPHDPLTVIDDPRAALSRLGEPGEWMQVRLPDPSSSSGQRGSTGYVAARYVRTEAGPPPGPMLTVYPTQDMNMRERPAVTSRRVGQLMHNAPLTVHDVPERARALVGRFDEWLYVQTARGQRGWVAAWYVSTAPT